MERKNERRSVVASGKTVEDAIANGLEMLSASRAGVDIEIITEGSRGVLGFGAENAQVRLLVKLPPEPAPVAAPVSVPEPEPELPTEPEPTAVEPPPPPTAPVQEPEAAQTVDGEPTPEEVGREVLIEILHLMGVRASVESVISHELAEEGQDPPTVLNITGGDLGILIGRRGETLRALQYLVRLMVSHRLKHWTNLIVDVENYLARRKTALEGLAQRVADQAVRTGRTQAMEPMPPYERRVVHVALRKHPQVTTQSVGEGERRKVTIIPK